MNDYVTVTQNFSAFKVNPAVKAKFKYPSSDPTPNEIEDDRTDAQKVDDILRIWAQILNPEEQQIWNQIAQRNIPIKFLCHQGCVYQRVLLNVTSKPLQKLEKLPSKHYLENW